MIKYKLIKEYPGSPCLGTIVEKDPLSKSYYHRDEDKKWCILNNHIEPHPEYWKKQVIKNKNLISISGAMGSGKDAVGKIIQYLLCKNTGEVSIDDVLKYSEHEWWIQEQSGFEIKKFAGKLKQIASILTGVSVEMWEDQEFKKKRMPEQWGMTYRSFLQRLGTEAMRDGLHNEVWINALFSDYRPAKMSEYNPSKWIITDTRFPNELEAIKERNGITINVVRPEVRVNGHIAHSSETSLKDVKFDYEIINDAGIPELVEKVKKILTKEGII
jgi:hypothetical protein